MREPYTTRMPTVSLIVTTHNGVGTLPGTLSALKDIARPAGGLEIFLIDNASTDATPLILHDAAEGLGARVITEPRKGKSFGLNRGLEASSGDFILFTDDDVQPDPNWVNAFLDAAARYPHSNVFAGQIRPKWLTPPPAWLEHLANRGRAYGCTAIDRKEGTIPVNMVKGANIMVRASAIGSHRYDEATMNYGAARGAFGGEDIKFVSDLCSDGRPPIYVPEARLLHRVREEETGLLPIFKRYVRIGGATARRLRSSGELENEARFRHVSKHARRMSKSLIAGDTRGAAEEMTKLAMSIGRFRERLRLMRRKA